MIEIQKPKIETTELSDDGRFGRFVVEPLERGFGNTLGNSLRRVLLSSLEGVAVTSIKIDGVLHEFSTIPGVKEDVTAIVLNMKGLIAKLHTNGPKAVEINAEGPCVVTAESIKSDAEVEILNPKMHIATLGEGQSSIWRSRSIRAEAMSRLTETRLRWQEMQVSSVFCRLIPYILPY